MPISGTWKTATQQTKECAPSRIAGARADLSTNSWPISVSRTATSRDLTRRSKGASPRIRWIYPGCRNRDYEVVR